MNIRKTHLLLIALSCTVLFLFCSSTIKERIIKSSENNQKLLIACVNTDYKNALLKPLVERYKSKYNIEIVNLEKLEVVEPAQYSVILIMDSTRIFTLFNRQIRNFIDRVKNHKKVIIFLTAGRAWEFKIKNVDAITSASSKESQQDSLKKITEKIDKISVSM